MIGFKQNYKVWDINAASDFSVIVMNDGIKGYLDDAEKETYENFINKHGRIHGFIVAYRHFLF